MESCWHEASANGDVIAILQQKEQQIIGYINKADLLMIQ